jgi:hypothetical protein
MTAEEVHKLLTYRKDRIRKRRRDKRRKRYIKENAKDMDIEKDEEVKK